MEFRQLLPDPGSVDVDDLLDPLYGLGDGAPPDRPYTVANFVATVDGRATIGGRSGPLGDDGDRAMFHGLRERVDAVFAGTTTLREENYGRVLGKGERRERRAARGLPAEPLACLVTRSGVVPSGIRLFAEPEARVVVFTPKPLGTDGLAAQVTTVVLARTELTLANVLLRLRRDFAVRSLLCEGGPTVFGALLGESLVDELFLTEAPKLAGGGNAPAIATGPELTDPRELSLTWLLERDGSLYHRYAIAGAGGV